MPDHVDRLSRIVGRPISRAALGVPAIVLSVAAMALADTIVKFSSAHIPLWQIFVVRSLIAIPIISCAGFLLGVGLRPRTLGWTLLRSLLLVCMYIGIYAAAPVLTMATIAASLYTGPLFIALLAAFVLGERVGLLKWLAIVLGFAGVLIILRPGTDAFTAAALVPVAAAAFYSFAAVLTNSKCGDENPIVLALALNYMLLVVGIVATFVVRFCVPSDVTMAYPFLLGRWVTMGGSEWGTVTVLALLIVGIGVGLSLAYQIGPVPVVATFDYSFMVFAAFWGYVFFGTVPNGIQLLGMVLIILSGALVVNTEILARLAARYLHIGQPVGEVEHES